MTEQKLTELLKHAYHWGRDNGSNRSEKNFNDFLQTEAVQKALSIANVSKRSWHIGEKVVVTHCIYGHKFDNGTTVEIVNHEPSQTTSWLCSDGKCSWWLSGDEGYVC